MNNPTKDTDNLINSLTSLKRTINKFNRNSDVVKINTAFGDDGRLDIYLKNTSVNDFKKLTDEDNCILKSYYLDDYYYFSDTPDICVTYAYINDVSIDDLILLINKIFTCLNHDVPKKSEFQEHCDLASELYSELPQWKKDAMKHDPYIYNPPDPQ